MKLLDNIYNILTVTNIGAFWLAEYLICAAASIFNMSLFFQLKWKLVASAHAMKPAHREEKGAGSKSSGRFFEVLLKLSAFHRKHYLLKGIHLKRIVQVNALLSRENTYV